MRNCIVLFALALIACSGKPYVVEPENNAAFFYPNRLFVASHGWHTGLIVPARNLNEVAPELEGRFGPVHYYEIGWGDKAFYQAREGTTGLALQAIFGSEGAVLHVVAIAGDPRDYFSGSEVLETCVSESGLKSLKAFLAGSFSRDSADRLIPLSRGIYRNSQFYLGEGRYHLMNTSNKWTAKALKSAGMGISPTFRLTAGSVMRYLESNRRPCGAAPAMQTLKPRNGGAILFETTGQIHRKLG
ncbi:TIGR02117 family protein [Methylomicrobium sp. RS1]|nr:TIGR02117 family protein [Methylomicrobium sp. RS1]